MTNYEKLRKIIGETENRQKLEALSNEVEKHPHQGERGALLRMIMMKLSVV